VFDRYGIAGHIPRWRAASRFDAAGETVGPLQGQASLQNRVPRFNSGRGLHSPARLLPGKFRSLRLSKPDQLCYTRTRTREALLFPGSSAVEQPAVNRLVAGSNPARGAKLKQALSSKFQICFNEQKLAGATAGLQPPDMTREGYSVPPKRGHTADRRWQPH
jgi:hypothetical protein